MEQAELQPTRPETAFVKTFPCTGCGAKLSFAPGTRNLKCEYCGTANEFAQDDSRIEELDFQTYLMALEGKMEAQEVEEVKCDKCGAEQSMAGHLFAGHCTFCGAAIVSKSYASRRIKPKSIVPFQVNKARAAESFRRWVRGLWLAPGDLKKYAQSDAGLTGVYLPYWTYDCQTASDYAGERGDDYYTTETYTTQDSAGPVGHADAAREAHALVARLGARRALPRRRARDGHEVAAREHHRRRHALQPEGARALPAGVRERLPGRGLPGDPEGRLPDREAVHRRGRPGAHPPGHRRRPAAHPLASPRATPT